MESSTNELRTDWLTGRSVFIAENRALRPNDFGDGEVALATGTLANTDHTSCPFCSGNESQTPPAVYEKLDQAGKWQVRVVPNAFPALNPPNQAAGATAIATMNESPRDLAAPISGPHEVIIESREHIDRLSRLSKSQLRDVLEAYAARLRHWRSDGRFRYGIVFKNQGPEAGASIAHLHSQLIALPFVPDLVAAEGQRAAASYAEHCVCPYCRLIEQERALGRRIVMESRSFIAFCPRTSLQPFEIWLMPTSHEPSFEQINSESLDRLADVLHTVVGRLEPLIPGAAYNLLLRTAPWTSGNDDWSHWRIELLPRVNSFAGLEIATGLHINPMPPEGAAERLRT